ncbi:hypothetical protein BRC61_04855 [Halobacteriales archaeon QH_10_65_19]|nr:MAG: hypothetical protein BRC61_04855 [Halobacteriales archaeon QH_10_65_19]
MTNPLLGFLLLAWGVSMAVWPDRLAQLEEQIDAIGSRRSWSEVEPAGWKVALTRIVGVAVSVFGLFVFLGI